MHRQNGWMTSFKVCWESIRKWSGDARILAIVCLVLLFAWIRIEPMRAGCIKEGLSITSWFFPFLIHNIHAIFYCFGILLLFCDAPFVDNQQLDVILRAGKKNWFRGKILYIVFASCIYYLWVFAVSILEFVPYVGFSTEWEDMMNILSIDYTYGGVVRRDVLVHYTPIEACLVQYLMCVLFAVFLGLLIFYCNLYKKQNIGMGLALFFVLSGSLIHMVNLEVMRKIVYFLPMAWTNIDIFLQEAGGVPFWYPVTVYCIGTMVLAALIMKKSKSYSIECQEEM